MSETEDPPTSADLERAILGASPELSAQQVADQVGVPLQVARRFWRSLGFADPGEATAFTSADVEALRLVAQTAEETGLTHEDLMRVSRGLGQTMARLAEWEVATLGGSFEEPAPKLMEVVGPAFERLLVYGWRRHLAAAVGRIEMLGMSGDDLHVTQATVGFADLVRFTSLTNQLDEDEIGDLVEVFESRCADVVTSHQGRVVKTLGDSVLFLCATAEQGIDTALNIVSIIGGDTRLPDVHVGMATGTVVLRMGDVYGPTVNLASRLTNVARRNRVIIDQATADLLPPAEFETGRLPARPVRGFGDVEPVTVRRTRPRH